MSIIEERRAYRRWRYRQIGYGRWRPYVDAAPAARRIAGLRAAGLGVQRIAELAGVAVDTVWRVAVGQTLRLRPWTANAILAVENGTAAGGAYIDATGTRRCVQALVALGWSLKLIADRAGVDPASLRGILTNRSVRAATAEAIAGAYDAMWDARPPQATPDERRTAARARKRARAGGWALPMEWDDDTINDPAATPASTEKPRRPRGYRCLPADEEIAWLCRQGLTRGQIADRYGVKPEAVYVALRRAETKGAA